MALPFDPDRVTLEVVRALRAGRSQRALSMRLGFSSNMLYRWESGRRTPRTEQVFALARKVGVDPAEALARLHASATATARVHPVDSPAFVTTWLVEACAAFPVADIAAAADLSRQSLGRLLRGETSATFSDFLAIVQVTTRMAGDFVGGLVDPTQVPSLAAHLALVARQRDCALHHPWMPGLMLLLDHPRYVALPAHDDAWVAHALGIATDDVAAGVAAFETARLVRWEGAHLVRAGARHVMTMGRQSMAVYQATNTHYADLASRRIADGTGMMSYTVFHCADEAVRDMADALYGGLRTAFNRAMASGHERVGLMTVQVVPLDDGVFSLRPRD